MQLYRALNGERDEVGEKIPPPFLWVISRICEEYGCLPTRALWELAHDPDQMAVQILPLRAFAAAKADYDQVGSDAAALERAAKRNPMVLTVRDIEHELVAATLARKRADAIARAMREEI